MSLQAFDREAVSTVVHIPDYKLRQQLSLTQKEPLIVEAFAAFEEMFYLHLSWAQGSNYPKIYLSSAGTRCHKVVLDLNVQSPHFTYSTSDSAHTVPAQWAPCTWSTDAEPFDVHRSGHITLLQVDRPPTHHNDINVSVEQTVTFTLAGTAWELDDSPIALLQCRSYRTKMQESELRPTGITARMTENVAAMKNTPDAARDIEIELDDGISPPFEAHAFVLQAQSPVFRRMLAGPMVEATRRRIQMAGVTPSELEDFLSAMYCFCVPRDVQEDDNRLLELLSLADRYEVMALRDECAAILETRLSEDNMAALLKVADMHQATRLRTAALEFIAARIERIAAVMDTEDKDLRASVREHLTTTGASYRTHYGFKEDITLTV